MRVLQVLIIELGSQFTLLIAKILRKFHVDSIILKPKEAAEWLETHLPLAVILSGGAASVNDLNAPRPPEVIWSLLGPSNRLVPVLGICYGMQLMITREPGGEVQAVPELGESGPR